MNEFIERTYSWFKNQEVLLNKKNFITKLTYASNTPNPAVRLDIENEQYIATIAVWASGESEMQVFDAVKGCPVIETRKDLGRDCNFERVFEEFFHLLDNKI